MNSNAQAAAKLARRKKRKRHLSRPASPTGKPSTESAAPNFGVSESQLLKRAAQQEQLTRSHNEVVSLVGEWQRFGVMEKALEAHLMFRALLTRLADKGIIDRADIQVLADELQYGDSGLDPKQGLAASVAELGDVLVMRFQVFDEGKIVDEEATPVVYDLGCDGFAACDSQLVGIAPGETRSVTATFRPGYRVKSIVGREVTIRITCDAIKTRRPVAPQPAAAAGG